MLVMTVLFIIILEFRWASLLDMKCGANFQKTMLLRNVARAGLAHAVQILRMSEKKYGAGDPWYNYYPGLSLANIFIVNNQEDFQYSISIEDEDGKINLNNLELNEEIIKLWMLFGYTQVRAAAFRDCLLDWLDKDNNHRLNGKEDDYYQTLTPRYHCKNAPMETLEEIFRIAEFNQENKLFFYGQNPKKKKLRDLATVFTGQEKKININTASSDILSIYLDLHTKQIEEIIKSRKFSSYKEDNDLKNLKIEKKDKIKFTSQFFRISIQAEKNDSSLRRYIDAVVHINEKKEVTFLYYLEK